MTYQELVNRSVAKMGHPRKYGKDKIKGYEQHHIIPQCMGGSDDGENIVYFTYAEHLMAHILLFRENPSNGDFAFTTIMMVGACKDFRNELVDIVDDEEEFFECTRDIVQARKLAQQNISVLKKEWWTEDRKREQSEKFKGENNPMFGNHTFSGSNNPMYGKSPSEESNKKRKASWTPEKRKLQSERNSGSNNPMYGKSPSEESNKKRKAFWTPENRKIHSAKLKGRVVSEETKAKMSENCSCSRAVRCKQTGEVFTSITKAAEWANVSRGSLSKHLRGLTKSCAGYLWEYVDKTNTQ